MVGICRSWCASSTDRSPHCDVRWYRQVGVRVAVQVYVIPGEGSRFFGARPGEQRGHDVGVHPRVLSCVEYGLGLTRGQRFGSAAWLARTASSLTILAISGLSGGAPEGGPVMGAARKRGTVRLARSILILLAVVVGVSDLAASAGASSRPSVAAGTLGNVISVASNSDSGSYCALLSTGRVDCWGANGSGQLGNGTATASDVPVAVLGITDAKAVASDNDGNSFCAVLSTGHMKCWGANGSGQLGNGTTTTSDIPVSAKNVTTATTVLGGNSSFCALLSTKHLDCWGYGGNGQLGDGTFGSSDVPVAVHAAS
jgi:Regulator of chromosome condensation (RCC1) repeat